MEYLPGVLAAYSIQLVAVLSPGPAVAMLLGVALSRGRASALFASLGVSFGALTIAALTLAGVGLLMQQTAWAVSALRLIGAAYLLWLAYGSFRKAAHPPTVAPAEMPPLSVTKAFTVGYLMQVTNPKAIVFWIAIASVGATDGAPAPIVALFLLGAFAMSLIGHAAYALALSASPVRALYHRARRGIEATLGTLFTLFAFKLATARS
ncbi:LysE family translocator [Tropicibacter naphthalenivorans]|uniref:Threonine efflux protein n=1 Tax=Tropicibacter naphthalenivorans TaxID=441103 RepID=A0A0P1G1B1_9RHOB|nr:LysE family translocator [Tropicibacter naphthalenivorans]CUH75399.1 Threonine efflux protein [Tropicibacter naphthalenivorans]SMC44653.1 Threonine/homoserine/homoserine lactone efflux protein [Tropicibacter naphthalenivorans]